MKKRFAAILLSAVLSLSLFSGCSPESVLRRLPFWDTAPEAIDKTPLGGESGGFPLSCPSCEDVPEFSGQPYIVVSDNIPDFPEEDLNSTEAFEIYSDLDTLGRCGAAYANICKELMPTGERGEIGDIKPSGWSWLGKSNNRRYDFVDKEFLYNRCHLIGWQLAGENANEKNLITGTRYLNVEGMLPFENLVADYVWETGFHVLYRVTPAFSGNNPLCTGVLMEALSVEDGGAGVCFCVFCYNAQPGVEIDYSTGKNRLADGLDPD